jgi:hypothetical protein
MAIVVSSTDRTAVGGRSSRPLRWVDVNRSSRSVDPINTTPDNAPGDELVVDADKT